MRLRDQIRFYVERFLLFVLAWLALLLWVYSGGCAPSSVGWSSGKGQTKHPPLVFEVENQDVAYPATVTVTWWLGSTVVGSLDKVIQPGKTATFAFAALPDGVEVTSDTWQPSTGRVWSGPDLKGARRVHANHPQATWWRDPP